MRVSLIDVDSKIPNLALMKISAYHKQKGNIVGFNLKNPDRVYHSIIFTKNKGKAKNKRITDVEHIFGGSGFSFDSWLSDEIEFIKPDYELYPSKYSQGYSSRGCNRNCYFCFVQRKEGKFRIWQHPKEFYSDQFDTIMLMDNNILLDGDWFLSVAQWCMDQSVKVDMTQGYDIRLVDEEIINQILEIRDKSKVLKFAFDDTKLEGIVRKKIDLLKDVGINTRNDVAFYVYCDNDSMHDDALYRCNVLRSLKVNADVMWNCKIPRTQRIKNLIYWSWRKQLFWSIAYEEYSKLLHT